MTLSPSTVRQKPDCNPETQQTGRRLRFVQDSEESEGGVLVTVGHPGPPGEDSSLEGRAGAAPHSGCLDWVPSRVAQTTQPGMVPLRGPRCHSYVRPGPCPAKATGRWIPDLFSGAVATATSAGALCGDSLGNCFGRHHPEPASVAADRRPRGHTGARAGAGSLSGQPRAVFCKNVVRTYCA